MDDLSDTSSPDVFTDRARTLVLRCWYERDDAGEAHLRGTVRDLSRGRAVPFDGLPALILQLRLAIGDGTPPPDRH